jgi:SAM-dependent methyltransferase
MFDMAYCGLVLHDLPDPVDVLRRMRRAVRAGGVVVVEDADFDGLFCHPANDGFDFYAASYCEVLRPADVPGVGAGRRRSVRFGRGRCSSRTMRRSIWSSPGSAGARPRSTKPRRS